MIYRYSLKSFASLRSHETLLVSLPPPPPVWWCLTRLTTAREATCTRTCWLRSSCWRRRAGPAYSASPPPPSQPRTSPRYGEGGGDGWIEFRMDPYSATCGSESESIFCLWIRIHTIKLNHSKNQLSDKNKNFWFFPWTTETQGFLFVFV